MKKVIISVLSVALILAVVFTCFACGKTPSNNNEPADKTYDHGIKAGAKYDASKVAIYNMDLSGIAGYQDKSVTNGTWAQTYDVLIGYIKKETDTVKRYQLMHVAEDILMATGDIVPIYYYTDTYMKKSNINGFFSSPLGYKYFMYSTMGDATALNACLASEPQTIDPALNSAVDGATMLVHLFAGLVKYDKDLNLVADCAESLPQASIDSETGEATYVFTLREGMKWSNGEDVLASDFEWAWKRAASTTLGADYGYMFEVVKGYGGDDVNGLAPLAVTANNEARTLTVVLTVDVPYFYELCAFPAYMPLYNRNNNIDNDGVWATNPSTYITNGAYTLKSWSHNELIVLEKSATYYDAANVTMQTLNLYLSDNANTMLTNFKTGTWQFIDDVPTEEIAACKRDYPNEFAVASQLGTYYICFNNNLNLVPTEKAKTMSVEEIAKANTEIRNAFSLLLDRTYICEEIGQTGQQPASSFVALGLTDPSNNGEEFYLHAGHSNDYVGYFDATATANESNAIAAVQTLKKYYNYENGKFTDFPSFTYLYNTSESHKAIGEYVQGAVGNYGITINLTNQEWNTFLETRKNGDYGVARNGWLGDYNDPISFLDMWTTGSGNNDVQDRKSVV